MKEAIYPYAYTAGWAMLSTYLLFLVVLGITYFRYNDTTYNKLNYKLKQVTAYCFIIQSAIVIILFLFFLVYEYVIPYFEVAVQRNFEE